MSSSSSPPLLITSCSPPLSSVKIPHESEQPPPPSTPEELMEQRSQWMTHILSENPQLLALRERVLPWTGGYSFANVVHTDTTAVLAHINRHKILELIYQHLNAIGMHRSAEILQAESGQEFQSSDQPWDKTDLLLLVSLGILPREDPWAILPDPHHQFVEESLEEDFFASPYREETTDMINELLDDESNAVFEPDMPHSLDTLKCASLKRIIILVTTSNDDADRERFFLILHSITSSYHCLEHLITLFDCAQLAQDDEEKYNILIEKQTDLRKRVINLITKWTKFHGLFIGRKTIKCIGQFLRRILDNPDLYPSIEMYAKPIYSNLPSLTYGMKPGKQPNPDQPDIPDPQVIFRPNLRLIDPSPTEVARQITLIFHAAFKAVHSREFMVALGKQCVSHQTPTLAEFFEYGGRLTLLCLETIVTSIDKNAAILQFLEIGSKLADLCNFDALAALIRALRCPEFSELSVWQAPAARENLKRLYIASGDDLLNRSKYEETVRQRYTSWATTIPNLRTELKSNDADNSPSFYDQLINWEKRWKISQKTHMLYRFQNKTYNFWPIPQIQNVIIKGPTLAPKLIQEKMDDLIRVTNK